VNWPKIRNEILYEAFGRGRTFRSISAVHFRKRHKLLLSLQTNAQNSKKWICCILTPQ
jgi:hypothetical protein